MSLLMAATATFTANPAGLNVLLETPGGDLGRYMLAVGVRIQNSAKRRCPVDTGRLRASISVNLAPRNVVTVSTDVNYALWVHEGTRHMTGRPFLRDAMQEIVSSG